MIHPPRTGWTSWSTTPASSTRRRRWPTSAARSSAAPSAPACCQFFTSSRQETALSRKPRRLRARRRPLRALNAWPPPTKHRRQAALPHLKPGAAVVNCASVTAYRGSPSLVDYASTKGAIVAFTRSLAAALLPRGVHVNAVAPGPVWTPLIPASFGPEKARAREPSLLSVSTDAARACAARRRAVRVAPPLTAAWPITSRKPLNAPPTYAHQGFQLGPKLPDVAAGAARRDSAGLCVPGRRARLVLHDGPVPAPGRRRYGRLG